MKNTRHTVLLALLSGALLAGGAVLSAATRQGGQRSDAAGAPALGPAPAPIVAPLAAAPARGERVFVPVQPTAEEQARAASQGRVDRLSRLMRDLPLDPPATAGERETVTRLRAMAERRLAAAR